jgi:hypothetical protein
VRLYREGDPVKLAGQDLKSWFQTWNYFSLELHELAGERVRLVIGVYNDGNGVATVHLDDVELWVRATS